MWGALIGMAYGTAAYYINVLFAAHITSKSGKTGKYVFVLVMIKYIALLGILIGLAFIALDVMIWAAGGCLVTMIACAVIKSIRASR